MGIKGIYKEIGPGERVALCKLAVDQLEQTGRPFRLAIDFSIWQFQVQAAKGGANPAIRTLFYRLVRLLGLAIRPIFVFDGPNKPAFKRNKRSSGRGGGGDAVATAMARRLIRLFGFATHDAPGEAEAECALLERQGVVDAVLSEDVDTIMFGCRRTLRNWSAEGSKGSKAPTHVSVYDAGAVAAGASGLDREGMVLVALMSGGDYLPEGVPGCGVRVACEAARAGFGRDLCRIKRSDRDALAAWKQRLLHELRTNESGFFRTRHKALEIPESFPNMEVLRYYTHPVVSQQATVDRLKREFPAANAVDVVGLREFARETFDWSFRIGAVKLIRVLAPSLLVQLFLDRSVSEEHQDDLALKQKEESALVKAISSRRTHFSTDATPELRLSFVPADIVKLDLNAEPEEEPEAFGRSGLALNSDDEFEDEGAEEVGNGGHKSGRVKKPFDPLQPDLVWVPVTVAKLGVPLTVEDWEGQQRLKQQRLTEKATRKTRAKQSDMPVGALDKYVKVTKGVADNTVKDALGLEVDPAPSSITAPLQCSQVPPHYSTRGIGDEPKATAPRGRRKQPKKSSSVTQASKPDATINPWTLTSSQVGPRVTKHAPYTSQQVQDKQSSVREPIVITSSPVAPTPPPGPGAAMTSSQATPTRSKRQQSPAIDIPPSSPVPFSPSPSPRKQKLATTQKPAEKVSAAAKPAQPATRTRPFKRVKSGAADHTATSTTQTSIKDYSRVLQGASSSQVKTKIGAADTQPIELLSDDEASLPQLKQPSRSPFDRDSSPAPGGSLDIDHDPFPPSPCSPAPTPAPPLLRRTSPPGISPPPPPPPPPAPTDDAPSASSTGSTSSSRPQQENQQKAEEASRDAAAEEDDDTRPRHQARTTTTSATTRLYIPRTSLDGFGFFSEVEVSRDKADEMMMMAAAAAARDSGGDVNGDEDVDNGRGRGTNSRRVWRLSEIEVLDLTGED
ncbi:hypothetical protein VTK56DRAFT_416 [Thermocarpiscus australiensis]